MDKYVKFILISLTILVSLNVHSNILNVIVCDTTQECLDTNISKEITSEAANKKNNFIVYDSQSERSYYYRLINEAKENSHSDVMKASKVKEFANEVTAAIKSYVEFSLNPIITALEYEAQHQGLVEGVSAYNLDQFELNTGNISINSVNINSLTNTISSQLNSIIQTNLVTLDTVVTSKLISSASDNLKTTFKYVLFHAKPTAVNNSIIFRVEGDASEVALKMDGKFEYGTFEGVFVAYNIINSFNEIVLNIPIIN